MAGSSIVFLSCCKNDGLWKATQAGSVLLMTISHSSMSSGVSLLWNVLAGLLDAAFWLARLGIEQIQFIASIDR